jgi:proteasome-associated ATPase
MSDREDALRAALGASGFSVRFVGQPRSAQVRPPTDKERADAWEARAAHLQQAIDQLQEKQFAHASVLSVNGRTCTVRAGDQVVEVPTPIDFRDEIRRGSTVLIEQQGRIVGLTGNPPRGNAVFVVERMVGDDSVEIQAQGGKAVVATRMRDLQPGDRVLLTSDGHVAVEKLPAVASTMEYSEPTGVSWGDVGGCAEAKRALMEAVVEPYKHAEVYRRHGHKPPKGVLLFGPPGNGKTMLGKASATALAELHGRKAGGFIYVKGPEILNKWVGASEAGVREIFAAARRHKREHGFPPVVFIDEADAIFGKRDGEYRAGGMERTIVPAFLAEMDGIDDSSALLVLATNRPEALDAAVVRDGRIDRRVRVGRPTREDAREILGMLLLRRRTEGPPDALAQAAVHRIWASPKAIYMLRSKSGKDRRVGLGEMVSGAILAGVVSRAAAMAIRREVETGQEQSLTEGDVCAAVDETALEMRHVDNNEVLAEVAREMGEDLIRVDRARD